MSWLGRLLSTRADAASLDTALRETLAHWQSLPPADLARTHHETRYVVLNTEATGLNIDKDRPLAVGAIAIDSGVLAARESLYVRLQPDAPTALADVLAFAGRAPIVVYSASLNRTLIERALAEQLGIAPDWTWIDLYWLLPRLFPERIGRPARLADWMQSFGIETFQRHHAFGDAYAIAQLLLALQARALRRGFATPQSLAELEQRVLRSPAAR